MTESPGSQRYFTLDAWRGLACLLVLVFHSTLYTSASSSFSINEPATWLISLSERLWLGVPMFFVISGYCITASADSARRKGYSAHTYFFRRFRRIFPPYWIGLAIFLPVFAGFEFFRPGIFTDDNHGFPSPWSLTTSQIIGNITLTEGWRFRVFGGDQNWFFGHGWTLGYEEQFYAITGFLLLFVRRKFFLGALLITVAVLAATPWHKKFNGFFMDGFWLHFSAGVLVFYAVNHASRAGSRLLFGALLVGIIFSASDPRELLLQTATRSQMDLVAFSFAAMLLVLHRFDKVITSKSHLIAPLTLCGTMCYSLYLVHWPVCKLVSHLFYDVGLQTPASTVLVTVPACLLASLTVGWLFHVFVERRYLNSPASPDPEPDSSHVPTPIYAEQVNEKY